MGLLYDCTCASVHKRLTAHRFYYHLLPLLFLSFPLILLFHICRNDLVWPGWRTEGLRDCIFFSIHLFSVFSNWLFIWFGKDGRRIGSLWRPEAGPNYIEHHVHLASIWVGYLGRLGGSEYIIAFLISYLCHYISFDIHSAVVERWSRNVHPLFS